MNTKRIIVIVALAAVLALGVTSSASAAGRWDTQVTGGVVFSAGSYDSITLDVSARTGDGDVKGQIQYVRSDLSFHVDVDCFYVDPNGNIALSGRTNVQNGSFGDWGLIEINADGDEFRVRDSGSDPTNCGYSRSYRASAAGGSFKIRS